MSYFSLFTIRCRLILTSGADRVIQIHYECKKYFFKKRNRGLKIWKEFFEVWMKKVLRVLRLYAGNKWVKKRPLPPFPWELLPHFAFWGFGYCSAFGYCLAFFLVPQKMYSRHSYYAFPWKCTRYLCRMPVLHFDMTTFHGASGCPASIKTYGQQAQY